MRSWGTSRTASMTSASFLNRKDSHETTHLHTTGKSHSGWLRPDLTFNFPTAGDSQCCAGRYDSEHETIPPSNDRHVFEDCRRAAARRQSGAIRSDGEPNGGTAHSHHCDASIRFCSGDACALLGENWSRRYTTNERSRREAQSVSGHAAFIRGGIDRRP